MGTGNGWNSGRQRSNPNRRQLIFAIHAGSLGQLLVKWVCHVMCTLLFASIQTRYTWNLLWEEEKTTYKWQKLWSSREKHLIGEEENQHIRSQIRPKQIWQGICFFCSQISGVFLLLQSFMHYFRKISFMHALLFVSELTLMARYSRVAHWYKKSVLLFTCWQPQLTKFTPLNLAHKHPHSYTHYFLSQNYKVIELMVDRLLQQNICEILLWCIKKISC